MGSSRNHGEVEGPRLSSAFYGFWQRWGNAKELIAPEVLMFGEFR